MNHNGLEWWFPRIKAIGLPAPTTVIVATGDCELIRLLDGETPDGFSVFTDAIKAAGDAVGWPAFLRTGQTSNKHAWDDTAFLTGPDAIPYHIASLVEFSEIADFMGLDYSHWAVREMLPTMPLGKLTAYHNMPLCREFRFFTKDGKVQCYHQYWPERAIRDGKPDWEWEPVSGMRALEIVPSEVEELTTMAEIAAAACPEEDWSIDFLYTARGFFLTDMAIASHSWHWPACQFSTTEEEPEDEEDVDFAAMIQKKEWVEE
jgi:hypothetical protein